MEEIAQQVTPQPETSKPIDQTEPLSAEPTPMHPFWQHFSKQTLALIVVLIVATAGLLYLAIRQEQPQPKAGGPVAQTPTLSPAHATLSLVEQTSTTSATQTVAVMIDSKSNRITGAQLAIAYDPKVLSQVNIQPGPYFAHPTPLFNTIDKTSGRISYVLVISPTDTQASGSGILATISFTFLPTAAKTTTLQFLPKTELTQEGISGSILKAATGVTIAIPQALQIQTATIPASGAAR